MTHPISNERVIWLEQRLKVVDECIKMAQAEMYAMNGGGAQRQDLQVSLMNFTAERMSLSIEHRVLQTKFQVAA